MKNDSVKYRKSNRRIFLKQAAALSILTGFNGFAADDQAGALSNGPRRLLSKAVPMIPPVPAMLLTVNGDGNSGDEITVVWTFVVNSHPAQIGLSVHDDHVALGLLEKHREFVLNVPTTAMVNPFDRADMNSKKSADKFKLTGLSRGRAAKVNAPVILESPIHVECKLFNIVKVPPTRNLMLASVEATAVLPHVCDEDEKLLVRKVPFFGMTPGSGEFFIMGDKVGHIGQTVGKKDIKY